MPPNLLQDQTTPQLSRPALFGLLAQPTDGAAGVSVLTPNRRLAQALQTLTPDSQWLARVEQSRLANPRSVELQYLSGMVCLRHSLWGKAQQLLEQAAPRLQSSELKRSAWRALAELAEQKGDQAQALACWKLSASA